MAHSLAPRSASAPPPPCPARKHQLSPPTTVGLDRLGWPRRRQRQQEEERASLAILRRRRTFVSGLVGAGFSAALQVREAGAAARRPPPPLPTEKKDPNVSGVQAKVLASKKRKEAMKEAMAELRERGKPVEGAAGGGEAVAGEPVGEPPQ